MKRLNASRKLFHKLVDNLSGTVGRTVVHRNHQHFVRGIFHRHQGFKNVSDDFLFVVSRHQHGDGWPVGCVNVDVRVTLETEESIQREVVVTARIDANHEDNDEKKIDNDE